MSDTKDEQKITADLLKALHGIQHELQLMNKALTQIAAGQGKAAPSEAPRRALPPRGAKPMGYGRAEGPAKRSSEEGGEQGFGFPKKKSPSRPKGKLPPKKGGGYPKKPR